MFFVYKLKVQYVNLYIGNFNVNMYMCICVYVYMCIFVDLHILTNVCFHKCKYVYRYICIYIYMCVLIFFEFRCKNVYLDNTCK